MHKSEIFAIFFLILISKSLENNEFIVEIKNGNIRGDNRGVYTAFEGIPYAEPPIGELRFEPPIKYRKIWNDVQNFTKPGSVCLQNFVLPGSEIFQGTEDCLFINVYVPSIPDKTPYPVIIDIHGGGFQYESSESLLPTELFEKGQVVYVRFNYRLGVFGFISTEDNVLPGNMGLKDQLLAIKWVKENIAAFNGDVNRILLVGASAGGASVHLQILHKDSKGLFHAALSQSGTATHFWAVQTNLLKTAKELGSSLKCPVDDSRQLKNCLKKLDAKTIAEEIGLSQINTFNRPSLVFGPTIEPKDSVEPFLTAPPLDLIKTGEFIHIPWLLGFSKDEGAGYAAYLRARNADGIEFIEEEDYWYKFAPTMLFYEKHEKRDEITRNCTEYYLKGRKLSVETYSDLQKLVSDRVFNVGLEISYHFHAAASKAPVYAYFYSKHHGPGTGFSAISSNRTDIDFGPGHVAEIPLIYTGGTGRFLRYKETADNKKIREHFYTMYRSFASTGIPTFGPYPLEPLVANIRGYKMMNICGGDKVETIKHPYDFSEMEFWEKIFPTLKSQNNSQPRKEEL